MDLVEQINTDGYAILENLIERDHALELRDELRSLLGDTGRNDFEGFATQRIYGVMARTLSCTPLVEHPRILELVARYLLPEPLLSQLVAINIQPGESAQALHHDDVLYPIDRPRPPVSVAAIWALDDFTIENGATQVIPGSHTWGDEDPSGREHQMKYAEMPAGSALFFLGTTWHGGGANQADHPRMAVTAQYCQPWARTVENFGLSTPLETVAQCSETVQSMLGFHVYSDLMGYVDGRHPRRLLSNS